jgi:hypothetical protein
MNKKNSPPKLTFAAQAKGIQNTITRVRQKTDGCTLAPDFDFQVCCIEHDLHYAENHGRITRLEADNRLRECISDNGRPVIALVYWLAVRVFGRASWKEFKENG